MTLHLIKMAVGITDPDHLTEVQSRRLSESRRNGGRGSPGRLWHRTRHMPRRCDALVDGGSIYWVIRKCIRVRQRLIGFEPVQDEEGGKRCLLLLDPELVLTAAWPYRAFQGWRYLLPSDAPPDRAAGSAEDEDLPPEMAAELRALGLL